MEPCLSANSIRCFRSARNAGTNRQSKYSRYLLLVTAHSWIGFLRGQRLTDVAGDAK